MNVLVMVHDMVVPNMGGGAPRTEAVAKALKRLGHDVFVMAPFGVSDEKAARQLGGCGIIRTRNVDRHDSRKTIKHALYAPLLALRTIYNAKKHRADLIFAHDSIYGSAALAAAKLLGIPFVFDATDLISEYVNTGRKNRLLYRLLSFGERLVIRNATRIITVSRVMKSILEKRGAKDVHVVYDGVDFSVFHPCRSGRRRNGRFAFVYQGGMDPQDGLEILVPAAERVVAEEKNAEFWLVGNGKALPQLKSAVKEKGLEKHFRFTGWVPFRKVTQYISDADAGLVILPDLLSARIRVTLKTFEYWACGKPVIAARLDALQEIIGRSTGLFYEPGDPEDLAARMLELCGDRKLRESLSREGAKEARKYEWPKLGKTIASLCTGVVSHGAIR